MRLQHKYFQYNFCDNREKYAAIIFHDKVTDSAREQSVQLQYFVSLCPSGKLEEIKPELLEKLPKCNVLINKPNSMNNKYETLTTSIIFK